MIDKVFYFFEWKDISLLFRTSRRLQFWSKVDPWDLSIEQAELLRERRRKYASARVFTHEIGTHYFPLLSLAECLCDIDVNETDDCNFTVSLKSNEQTEKVSRLVRPDLTTRQIWRSFRHS